MGSVTDCTKVLASAIPLEAGAGTIQRYIAVPKPNGYYRCKPPYVGRTASRSRYRSAPVEMDRTPSTAAPLTGAYKEGRQGQK